MSEIPDGLTLERNRDLQARGRHVWYRRALLCAVGVLPVLALLNVFGQRPTVTSARASAADLEVTAPARLRSGLVFQVRVKVIAHRSLAKPQLVFDRGWWESMSVNSLEPDPSSQSSRDGRVVLSYDKLDAGQALIVWLYFQVNPTTPASAARTWSSTTARPRSRACTDPSRSSPEPWTSSSARLSSFSSSS